MGAATKGGEGGKGGASEGGAEAATGAGGGGRVSTVGHFFVGVVAGELEVEVNLEVGLKDPLAAEALLSLLPPPLAWGADGVNGRGIVSSKLTSAAAAVVLWRPRVEAVGEVVPVSTVGHFLIGD